jgi:hypothetical protein
MKKRFQKFLWTPAFWAIFGVLGCVAGLYFQRHAGNGMGLWFLGLIFLGLGYMEREQRANNTAVRWNGIGIKAPIISYAVNGRQYLAVIAVNIQRQVGGNLAELLETVAETVRERERLRRHVKALSAEGRLSAVILFALPILVAALPIVLDGGLHHPATPAEAPSP